MPDRPSENTPETLAEVLAQLDELKEQARVREAAQARANIKAERLVVFLDLAANLRWRA